MHRATGPSNLPLSKRPGTLSDRLRTALLQPSAWHVPMLNPLVRNARCECRWYGLIHVPRTGVGLLAVMFVVLRALPSSCWSRNDLEVGQFAAKRRFIGLDSATVPLQPRCLSPASCSLGALGMHACSGIWKGNRIRAPLSHDCLCLARFAEDTPCHTGDGLIVAAPFLSNIPVLAARLLGWPTGCCKLHSAAQQCPAAVRFSPAELDGAAAWRNFD